MSILEQIIQQAKAKPRRIVLPESSDERVLRAAVAIQRDQIAHPLLIGQAAPLQQQAQALGLDLSAIEIIDPTQSTLTPQVSTETFRLREKKGVTAEQAAEMALDPLWFGTMLVRLGHADGAVSGAVNTTANVVRTALQAVGVKPGTKLVSSFFLMIFDQPHQAIQGATLFADCALTIEPDAEQLAEIALATADNARRMLGTEPRIAMLSFSSSGSAQHAAVDKVTEATRLVREADSTLLIDGEVQFDAAIVPAVAASKVQDSQLNGTANVFIFPSLEAANIGYKIAQRIGAAKAVGPFLQGLNQPVNDLSRGCSVDDIYNTVATTAVQVEK